MFDELPVIALCGSMRFRDEFERLEAELMLARIVVGSRTILSPSGPLDAAQRERLGGAQLQKVAMADEILVVNVDSVICDVMMSPARSMAGWRCPSSVLAMSDLEHDSVGGMAVRLSRGGWCAA